MCSSLIAEIDLAAIRHNVRLIRERVGPGVAICAAVKADAYGHGLSIVAPALADAGVEMALVATIEEAIELRALGWTRLILCFASGLEGANDPDRKSRLEAAVSHDVTCTVIAERDVRDLCEVAARIGRSVRVHVKVDTGMGRSGCQPDEALGLVDAVRSSPHLELEGFFTHFATADEPDLDFAREQLATFAPLTWAVADLPNRPTYIHAANTASIFRLTEAAFDLVRPGLGLYGYWPEPAVTPRPDLRPCLRLLTQVAGIRSLPRGRSVGYGRAAVLERNSRVGLLPVGYADGYSRALGCHGVVTLAPSGGRPARTVPVLGRISMDLVTIDLTDAPDAAIGDIVVLIDPDPSRPNSVESSAAARGTIPYEVTCLLGRRVERIGVDPDAAVESR